MKVTWLSDIFIVYYRTSSCKNVPLSLWQERRGEILSSSSTCHRLCLNIASDWSQVEKGQIPGHFCGRAQAFKAAINLLFLATRGQQKQRSGRKQLPRTHDSDVFRLGGLRRVWVQLFCVTVSNITLNFWQICRLENQNIELKGAKAESGDKAVGSSQQVVVWYIVNKQNVHIF